MKLDYQIDGLDVYKCKCGCFIPVKTGSKKPKCEFCRRVKLLKDKKCLGCGKQITMMEFEHGYIKYCKRCRDEIESTKVKT